jgi:glucose-6-phosphate 1-dehydrogenase
VDIQKAGATILIIMGAAGDLTWRKLVPAVYNLHLDGWLPEKFAIVGVDLKEMSLEDFQKRLKSGVDTFSRSGKPAREDWQAFCSHCATFICGSFDDTETYEKVGKFLEEKEREWNTSPNRVYYLATPPSLVETITENLGRANMAQDEEHVRIVVEKPFGSDLASATALNRMLARNFAENQLYRIDHYLGKETVQNILAFRFANALFEPIWDRRYIDYVELTVAETVGVEHRGGYYEHAGALRDMIQNHLLQLLCLVAMEPPVSFQADEIRNKKVDVLRAIRPINPQEVAHVAARGQYGPGWIQGEKVVSYREEAGVSLDSMTETFAAVKFYVDNWRWQDVPFYLRTGKRMIAHFSDIAIQFHPVPHQSFPSQAVVDWQPNRLAIRIQPDEGIMLRFQAKQPGPRMLLRPEELSFKYREAFNATSPEAYETLLLDVMIGDSTLFMRADQIEASWQAIMPILEAWQISRPLEFPNYQSGTWGPQASEALIARDGRSWMTGEKAWVEEVLADKGKLGQHHKSNQAASEQGEKEAVKHRDGKVQAKA